MLIEQVGAGDAVLALLEGHIGGRDLELAWRRARLPFSTISFGAAISAPPWQISEREPKVPVPSKLRRRDVVDAQLDPVLGKAEDVGDQRRETPSRAPAPTGRRWKTSRACRRGSMRDARSAPCRRRPTARGTAQARCRAACRCFFAALRRASKPSQSAACSARIEQRAPDRRCRRSSRSASSAGTRPSAAGCGAAA